MQVSVIIPVSNAAATVERAFRSAREQRGIELEIILVDNGSTDGSAELLQELASGDTRTRFTREVQPGAAAARNHGARLAVGDWLQFLDADDYLLPGKLARQVALGRRTEARWVIGRYRYQRHGIDRVSPPLTVDPWIDLAHCRGFGNTNANLYRADFFREVGGMDPDYAVAEDYRLYFKLLRAGYPPVKDSVLGSHYDHRPRPGGTPQQATDRLRYTRIVIDHLREHTPVRFTRRRPALRAALLRAFARSFTLHPPTAKNLIREHPPELTGVDWADLPAYCRLYPYLGLPRTEALRAAWRRLRNNFLPSGS